MKPLTPRTETFIQKYTTIYRQLYEEIKQKRKTEDLSLKIIKEVTRIKSLSQQEFITEITTKPEVYFDLFFPILDLESLNCNLILLDLFELYLIDEWAKKVF